MTSYRLLTQLLPELTLFAGIITLFILSLGRKKTLTQDPAPLYPKMGLCVISAVLLITIFLKQPFFSAADMIASTPLSYTLKLILLGLSACILVAATLSYSMRRAFNAPYVLLFLIMTLGGLMVFAAMDLVLLFVALELQTLPLYILITLSRSNGAAVESGMKYIVLGGLSSGILLFGISLIYGAIGSTHLLDVTRWTQHVASSLPWGFAVGLTCVILALAFKLSLFPGHIWTPDVYEGAETHTTLALATLAKMIALGFFIRLVCEILWPIAPLLSAPLSIMAILSMLWGALGALAQDKIKRLMAYGTIAHMGYVCAALATLSTYAAPTVLLYAVIYFPTVIIVLLLCVHIEQQHTSKGTAALSTLQGYVSKHPWHALALGAAIFSLAGVPPFPGFFGKMALFFVLVHTKSWLLCSGLIASSAVSIYYYLRVVKALYFVEKSEGESPLAPSTL